MNRHAFCLVLACVLWIALGAVARIAPLLPFENAGPGSLLGALTAWITAFLLFAWPVSREFLDREGPVPATAAVADAQGPPEPRLIGWVAEAFFLASVSGAGLCVAWRLGGDPAWTAWGGSMAVVLLAMLVAGGVEGFAAAWPRVGRGTALAILALAAFGMPALHWLGSEVGEPPLGDWWRPFAPFEALASPGEAWHGLALGHASAIGAILFAAAGIVAARMRSARSSSLS